MTQPAAVATRWEERFRAPKTAWVQIAIKRPERGLIASNRTGVYQLHRWNVETGKTAPLTDDPVGKAFGWLSPDGRWVVWHRDEAGNELGHFVAVPWEGGETIDLTPQLPLYSAFTGDLSADGAFASATVAAEGRSLVVVEIGEDGRPAEPTVLDPGPGFVTAVALSRRDNGRRLLAYSTTGGAALTTKVIVVDVASGERLHEIVHPDATVTVTTWSASGALKLLGSTTQSGSLRPIVLDARGDVRSYPLESMTGDFMPVSLSGDGKFALLLRSDRATERLYVLDLDSGDAREIPGLTGSFSVWGASTGALIDSDGSVVVVREDATTPTEVVRVRPDGSERRTLIEASHVPESQPFRSVDIPSADGVVVQGWLATPRGSGPFPTVLEIHGGPQAHETDRFHPEAHAWLDAGYAFLTLNYRGSNGFGKEYEEAIWGRLGTCELEDMVAAREFLVREGVAREDQVVVTGGSYGGFMTLYALGARPELWACGVALVAIADWRLLYEDGEALRDYERALFDGTPSQRPDVYAASSPITYLPDLRAPLLIIQGRNDARCPARQMEVYVDEARRLGKNVEIDWFDAGHGHGAVDTRIGWQRRAMEFVERQLRQR
jgi:dipeptidyl aminopeptidase/acylaminoacyl peptidase